MAAPTIIFHFTNKKAFYKILELTFKLSYAREKINGSDLTKEFAVPMVSFCDLRLSELKEHISKYGAFGIGLTKEWAVQQGLNPVMYISQESLFTNNFLIGLNNLHLTIQSTTNQPLQKELNDSYMNLFNSFRYMKNYDGILDKKKKKRKYRFADEREWRYVPAFNNGIVFQDFLQSTLISTPQEKAEYNQQLNHLKLSFQPDDIKYLIVKAEKDIDGLIEHLQQVKGGIFTPEIVSRLSSRILTADQIKNDV